MSLRIITSGRMPDMMIRVEGRSRTTGAVGLVEVRGSGLMRDSSIICISLQRSSPS